MSFKDLAFSSEARTDVSDVPENILRNSGRRGRDSQGFPVYYRKTSAATQIGEHALPSGDQTSAVGAYAYAAEDSSTAVGVYARATGNRTTTVGRLSRATGNSSTHVGENGTTTGNNATSVGQGVKNTGVDATTVGQGNTITGDRAVAVGRGITIAHDDTTIVGKGGTSTDAGQVIIGTSDSQVNHIYLGRGVTHTGAAGVVAVHTASGSGTNVEGDTLQIAPGLGTGNAESGDIEFFRGTTGASSATINSYMAYARLGSDGIVQFTGTGSYPTGIGGTNILVGPTAAGNNSSGMVFATRTNGNANELSLFISANLSYTAIASYAQGTGTNLPLTFWTNAEGGTATVVRQIEMADGMIINDGTATRPTGGFKGFGTLNVAGDVYKNNGVYLNPDYAFEHAFTGNIERFAGNPGAKEYRGLKPLCKLESYAKKHFRLPGAHKKRGAFERFDFLLEKVEEIFLYLFDINRRLKRLEK